MDAFIFSIINLIILIVFFVKLGKICDYLKSIDSNIRYLAKRESNKAIDEN